MSKSGSGSAAPHTGRQCRDAGATSPPASRWTEVLIGADADIRYNAGFLSAAAADRCFDAARSLSLVQEEVRVFGRRRLTPRLTAWFAPPDSPYAYSGAVMTPRSFPPFLESLRKAVQAAVGLPFNAALANFYRHGRDAMGWHSDDEPELGEEIHIASLSLGAERTFRLRAKNDARRAVSLELGHGSLLLMRHPSQRHLEHCLPARTRLRAPRANFTFRNVVRAAAKHRARNDASGCGRDRLPSQGRRR